jgi:hypothetical protein
MISKKRTEGVICSLKMSLATQLHIDSSTKPKRGVDTCEYRLFLRQGRPNIP